METGVGLRSGTKNRRVAIVLTSKKIRIDNFLGKQVRGIEMKIARIIFATIAMMTSASAGINNETSCDNPGYRMDQRCVGQ